MTTYATKLLLLQIKAKTFEECRQKIKVAVDNLESTPEFIKMKNKHLERMKNYKNKTDVSHF